jgi:NCS1 family nucleobase:cation symporter-1
MLGWIIKSNHGTGPLLAPIIPLTKSARALLFFQCISSVASSWSAISDRISDWTRYSRKRHSATPAMIFATPFSVVITSLIGILITSAVNDKYGAPIWNPLAVLQYVQDTEYTAKARAGTFFAGVGILSCQIFVSFTQDSYGFGMDLAGVFPKYISIRRGALIQCVIAAAINPWRFLSQAVTFLQVLNCLSGQFQNYNSLINWNLSTDWTIFKVFAAANSAIFVADYFIVRQKKWKIPDLYVGNNSSIYWFSHGWNFRALAAFVIAITPSMRKCPLLATVSHFKILYSTHIKT